MSFKGFSGPNLGIDQKEFGKLLKSNDIPGFSEVFKTKAIKPESDNGNVLSVTARVKENVLQDIYSKCDAFLSGAYAVERVYAVLDRGGSDMPIDVMVVHLDGDTLEDTKYRTQAFMAFVSMPKFSMHSVIYGMYVSDNSDNEVFNSGYTDAVAEFLCGTLKVAPIAVSEEATVLESFGVLPQIRLCKNLTCSANVKSQLALVRDWEAKHLFLFDLFEASEPADRYGAVSCFGQHSQIGACYKKDKDKLSTFIFVDGVTVHEETPDYAFPDFKVIGNKCLLQFNEQATSAQGAANTMGIFGGDAPIMKCMIDRSTYEKGIKGATNEPHARNMQTRWEPENCVDVCLKDLPNVRVMFFGVDKDDTTDPKTFYVCSGTGRWYQYVYMSPELLNKKSEIENFHVHGLDASFLEMESRIVGYYLTYIDKEGTALVRGICRKMHDAAEEKGYRMQFMHSPLFPYMEMSNDLRMAYRLCEELTEIERLPLKFDVDAKAALLSNE